MQFAQKSLGAFVRYLLVAVVMVSVMPVLPLFTGTALAAPGATIPDENLRTALGQALGKREGAPITQTELADLEQRDASVRSISDLTGLEHCTGLTYLNLDRLWLKHNTIGDISVLTNQTNLEVLGLINNTISDISTLASLSNLQQLELTSNNISDTPALASLATLQYLHLENNTISDISVLSELTSLQYLFLDHNTISTSKNQHFR